MQASTNPLYFRVFLFTLQPRVLYLKRFRVRIVGAHVVTIRLGDFAQDDMWNAMSIKKRTMYNEFFNKFNMHPLNNYGMTGPKKFGQSSLYLDFKRALLAADPPATITCALLRLMLFYLVIESTRSWIQYYLLDLLMRFSFQWKPPRVEPESTNTYL